MTARYTAKELAAKYDLSLTTVTKKMRRHGYSADPSKRYLESDFLKAQAAGAEADKAAAAAQLAEHDGESLQAKLLRRKIALADIEIKASQAKLDELLGRVIEVEKHKEHCMAIAQLMITWWEQASEGAATKIKDATVLDELRLAGERARQEILDFA